MGLFNLLLIAAGLMWPVFARPNERAPVAKPFNELLSEERIIGGTDAAYGSHPYICYLYTGTYACGSMIYNERTIITAAHCLHGAYSAAGMTVKCGEHRLYETDAGEQLIPVRHFLVHERYEHDRYKNYPNDIALLELESPLHFTSYVQSGYYFNGPVSSGQNCQLIGWGRFGDSRDPSPVLQEMSMRLLDKWECQNEWGSHITDGHICFWDRGSYKTGCHGDSGGPAICAGQLVGVASFVGGEEGGLERCNKDKPSVYTRISHYKNWIESNAF